MISAIASRTQMAESVGRSAVRPINVGNRAIGGGLPCFLVAEVGINHNGDLDLAHRLIDAAAAAGADGVKFQNYRTEDFLSDRTLTYRYISQGRNVEESQFDMFKRCELASDSLLRLKRHCDEAGLVFFSTPSSQAGVAELESVGAGLLKNASDSLGHLPLIRAMARSRIPTILSTGMATLADIDEAVTCYRAAGGEDLILLHCTSSYPTPPTDVHLHKIQTLASTFGCPAGLSDHTDGIIAALGAVALGACVVEKHFTLDKNAPGPDHRFSADPEEFGALTSAVRTLETNLGSSFIGPTPSEAAARLAYRLSCVAARDLPAGYRLTAADLAYHRPGTGLPPASADLLLGRKLHVAVPRGHLFRHSDLD